MFFLKLFEFNNRLLEDYQLDELITNLSKTTNSPDSNKLDNLLLRQSISTNSLSSLTSDEKEKGITYVLFSNINIILIENQSEYFYPFLTFKLYNMVARIEFQLSKGLFTVDLDTISKIISYNYIADAWEPLIEKCFVKIKFIKQINLNVNRTSFDILIPLQEQTLQQTLNINLSDLNVSNNYFYLII